MSATVSGRRQRPALGMPVSTPELVSALVLIATVILVVVPLGFLVYSSLLTAAPGSPQAHLTAANWRLVLNPHGRTAILNTLQLGAYVTVFALILGSFFAWIVSRADVPLIRPLSVLLVLPMLLSPLLTTLAWTVLASPRSGLINAAFHHLVPGTAPLLNVYSLAGMVVIMTLYFTPFAYLVMLGAVQGVDTSFEDASRVAGAGVGTTLRRITLPVVTPALISAGLLIFALACEQLAVPTLLGLQAKLPTLQYEIYLSMLDSPSNPNYAAAAGCFLLLITVAGILLYSRMVGVSRRFVTISGKATAAKRVSLGAWRFVALAVVLLYLFVAVVAPYAALILGSLLKYVTPNLSPDILTTNNYRELLRAPSTVTALRNTLVYSAVGASAAVAFSLLLGYMTVRRTTRMAPFIEFFAMLPLSVPAISLGLGILYASLAVPIGVYGTVWILGIAYLTRFSPQGIRTLSASLIQVDPELELASRVAGASWLTTIRRITLPLVRPALLAAWTLLFVQISLEISMTILLYTPKTATAALNIWFAYFGGDATLAYSMAVIMATLSFAAIFFGQRFAGLLSHVR